MLNYKKGEIAYIDLVVDWLLAEAEKDEFLKPHLEKLDVSNMWSYIEHRARDLSKNGCAVIKDEDVYGWAKHFALEDGNVEARYAPAQQKPQKKEETKQDKEIELDMNVDNLIEDDPIEEKEVKPAKPKKDDKYGGFNLFDNL